MTATLGGLLIAIRLLGRVAGILNSVADTHRKARNIKGLPCFRGGPGSVWSGLLACGCAISPSGDYLFRLEFLFMHCYDQIHRVFYFAVNLHLHFDFHVISFLSEAVLHSLQ